MLKDIYLDHSFTIFQGQRSGCRHVSLRTATSLKVIPHAQIVETDRQRWCFDATMLQIKPEKCSIYVLCVCACQLSTVKEI